MGAILVLMCGLPGSGKTTLARRLSGELPAIRLCTDEWQAALRVSHSDEVFHDLLEDQLWKFGKNLIRIGQTVIFEKGLWRRSERDEKRREAAELGIDTELHYFDVPLDELARRLEARNAEARAHECPVTAGQMQDYAKIFQPPDEAELALFARSVVHSQEA
jgi:predicted kinase